MISLITITNGRELYLSRLLNSITKLGGLDGLDFEYFLYFQERKPSDKLNELIDSLPFRKNIIIRYNEKQQTTGEIITKVAFEAKYPIFGKIDDDNVILSDNFFPIVYELCQDLPISIVYPFIVSGELTINSLSGKKQSIFLSKNNLYMTFGEALGCSGKYFLPTHLAKKIHLEAQDDATMFKIASMNLHIPIFQSLNGLVIENQEGYSGQSHRSKILNGQTI